jgi:hypothetical protein
MKDQILLKISYWKKENGKMESEMEKWKVENGIWKMENEK